ncbi:hypothetical protein H5410_017497 [Solanum commersonii]|uniref:Tryptophan synthase beta chain-like PALP domain-containing protein n=1 Tax=Solanum commersonii TaxID=4109 RepID=A0A9J5ZZG0_SOLCO|nr:hypothetical protein H5410_017497 [Solanum commersonii]
MEDSGSPFQFLTKKPYEPPSWASHHYPIPSHTFSLGHFPTPIHKWNLPNLPKKTEVWVKRDDLSGMQLSGNEVRKLEFLLADAVAQGADCIVTIGVLQSNHCRATAVAAKYLNLDCYLILLTKDLPVDKDPGFTGNLIVDRLVGAHIDLVSKEEYANVGSEVLTKLLKEKLLNEGRKPYVIPEGGSNSLGTWGYIEAIREVEQQLQHASSQFKFDDIVVACSSGGTVAGLSVASRLSGLKAKVHAFSVCDHPDYFYEHIQGLHDGINAGVSSRDIVNIENARGLGYAMNTIDELTFVKQVAETTGVILDPVYSLHGTARASIAEKSSSRRRNRRATGRPPSLLRLSSLLFSSPPARWSNQQLQLVTTAASERRGPPTSSLEKRAAVAIGNNNNNKSTAADFSGAFEDFELIKRWILTDPSR